MIIVSSRFSLASILRSLSFNVHNKKNLHSPVNYTQKNYPNENSNWSRSIANPNSTCSVSMVLKLVVHYSRFGTKRCLPKITGVLTKLTKLPPKISEPGLKSARPLPKSNGIFPLTFSTVFECQHIDNVIWYFLFSLEEKVWNKWPLYLLFFWSRCWPPIK